MNVLLDHPRATLIHGDAAGIDDALAENSVDAIVTDPPAGIGFMDREWDSDKGGRDAWIAWLAGIMSGALAVLKPGGYALVWAIPRTSHWTAMALEAAGFEIRDVVVHLNGTGFPKSLSVHKASINRVQSRYGERTCICLDGGDGPSTGHGAGRGDRSADREDGERAARPSGQTRDRVVQEHTPADGDVMRQLRGADGSGSEGPGPIETAVLLDGVRGGRSEAARLGHAALRPGVEEPQGANSRAGFGVSGVRQNTVPERIRAACTPPETVSVCRLELAGESGRVVRSVPSHDRVDDNADAGVDPCRGEPRRVHLDGCTGRRDPVARVCSWCGLPDAAWLATLVPLGSALKPAAEHWILARKPLDGTYAANVLKHGTGALNIDGCRIGSADGDKTARKPALVADTAAPFGRGIAMGGNGSPLGRWPANVTLSHAPECMAIGTADDVYACAPWCAVRMLDGQSGERTSGRRKAVASRARAHGVFYGRHANGDPSPLEGSTGGASRFFAVFKGDECSSSVSAVVQSSNPTATVSPSGTVDGAAPVPPTGQAGSTPGGVSAGSERSTSATPSGSNRNAAISTPAIPSTGKKFSPGPSPGDTYPASLAAGVVPSLPTDTTRTTTGPSTSNTCVDAVTSTSTSPRATGGVPVELGGSRFIYVAKGARSEKDAGLDHLPVKSGGEATDREEGSAGLKNARAGAGRTGGARNFHPTVKSVDLMRWLVRLITPPGGTVLDLFAGSGTTGIAALAEGCSFIGVEQGGKDGEYLPILTGRIRHALGMPATDEP